MLDMSSDEINQKLGMLTKREREVLSLRCDGKSYKAIAKLLHIEISTVKSHMHHIYINLGLEFWDQAERIKAIYEIYCKRLKNLDLPPPAEEAKLPVPVSKKVKRMVDDDEKTLIPWKQQLPTVIPRPDPHKPWRPPPWVYIIIGLLLGMFVMWLIMKPSNVTGEDNGTGADKTPEPEIAQVVEDTVSPAEDIQGTPAQASVLEVETTPAPAFTLTSSPSITPTSAPTNTPTFTSTPTSDPRLFWDDFEAGIKPEWNMDGNNFTMVDGVLSSLGWLTAYIGDSSWTNYAVEFELSSASWSDYGGGLEIHVRRIDDSNYVSWQLNTFTRCNFRWLVVENGQAQEVANSQRSVGVWRECPGRWRIEVAGDTYKTFKDGDQKLVFTIGGFSNGGVGLVSRGEKTNLTIDYFEVRKLP